MALVALVDDLFKRMGRGSATLLILLDSWSLFMLSIRVSFWTTFWSWDSEVLFCGNFDPTLKVGFRVWRWGSFCPIGYPGFSIVPYGYKPL